MSKIESDWVWILLLYGEMMNGSTCRAIIAHQPTGVGTLLCFAGLSARHIRHRRLCSQHRTGLCPRRRCRRATHQLDQWRIPRNQQRPSRVSVGWGTGYCCSWSQGRCWLNPAWLRWILKWRLSLVREKECRLQDAYKGIP